MDNPAVLPTIEETVLKAKDTLSLQAIGALSAQQRELFVKLASAQSNTGREPTLGQIERHDLLEMMATDTPLARVAFGIFLGRIALGNWSRSVSCDDIVSIPDLVTAHPHLQEMGLDKFYNDYCYGITHRPNQTDNIPLAYHSLRLMQANPALRTDMIARLQQYKSKTYLGEALADARFAEAAAQALLEFPLEPDDLPREIKLCETIMERLPQTSYARQAQERIDLLFEQAQQQQCKLNVVFLSDLIANKDVYRERAFRLALGGYSIEFGQRHDLLRDLLLNSPTPSIKLRTADHLLALDDSHDYWGVMNACMFVFEHVSERQEQAFAILEKRGQRRHLIDAAQRVPSYAYRCMDILEEKDRKDIEHSQETKQRHCGPVFSSTDSPEYFKSFEAALKNTEDPALAERFAAYITSTIENPILTGTNYNPYIFVTVIGNPHVSETVKEEAWKLLQPHDRDNGRGALLRLAKLKISPYSMRAAEAVLGNSDIYTCKILVQAMAGLDPNLQKEAGVRILNNSEVTNEDVQFVQDNVPSLADMAAGKLRPAYGDVVTRLKSTALAV